MTKFDCIKELEGARNLALSAQTDFFRGEVCALDYAIEIVGKVNPYSVRKTYKNVLISLTREQAKYLSDLLGNGALDRLIKSKIERGMSEML